MLQVPGVGALRPRRSAGPPRRRGRVGLGGDRGEAQVLCRWGREAGDEEALT
jgi:hypothetical protein